MVGILVHGDNHFIARGPLPDRETALALFDPYAQSGTIAMPLVHQHFVVRRP